MIIAEPITAGGAGVAGLSILIGLLLVFFGRRLFWVFVAMVGFLAGMRLAPILIYSRPDWMILASGLALGIFGALFAILLQRVAVAVAGAAVGGALAGRLILALGWSDSALFWGAVIVGAVIAAALATVLFDWALIWLTTTSGAILVCDAVTLPSSAEWALGLTLFVLGILFQARSILNPPASGT